LYCAENEHAILVIIVVMGVTGSGKTTVGRLVAARLGWLFADADDFHSAVNKDKMHKGIPLTDADRFPWLAAMHEQISKWIATKQNAVLACSALKQIYRRQLWDDPGVRFVYLKGSYDLIAERLRARKGHFADEHILAGQFADLEEPSDAIVVDISPSPDEIVAEICQRLGLDPKIQ
jgi:gluconokinase